jgi:hypothetical protein
MAHLKPHQKLFLTNSHIIPHFLHKTVLATPSITTIPAMDQAVRNHIKGILHLPVSTLNGLLYCIKRDGGLGIRKLEVLASTTALKQGITLLNTHEPTIHALLHKTKLEQRLQSIAKAIRLQWPIQNYRAIDAYKRSQKKDELKSWGQLQSKVRGVASFSEDRVGNDWLYNPCLLKPSRFITALKMRNGMTSDKVTMNKVVPQTNVKCRKCKVCNETLAHILGQCVYTKTQRIKRHDEIRDFVSKRVANMSEKAQIIEEASIPTPTGSNLKPDLVVVSRGRVHVVDVTVRHEDVGYLEGYEQSGEIHPAPGKASDPIRSGEAIPASTADDSITYLGGWVSPWFGITYKDFVAEMRPTFQRLRAAPLKPHQKLSLLTTYIIPHFLHKTSIPAPPVTTIRAIDDEIGTIVKDVLHLPASTPNGLLYTGKRDGGLGIPKLETLATCITLKQGILFLNSLNPLTQVLASATQLEGRMQRKAKTIRLQWPALTFQQIDNYKKNEKQQVELNNWKSLSSKGKGAHSIAHDRLGNAWLYNPRLLKPSRFLTALRLRGCVIADRVTLNKAIPQASTKCRKCKTSQETLGHILGQCIHTKAQRIRRHNEIRDIVSSKLAKKNRQTYHRGSDSSDA